MPPTVKGPFGPPPDAVVHMTNNRPTICTTDEQNCVSITSRVHFDAGGYDYHPNTAGTVPQKLDDGVNTRRARIGILGKFFGDWNYALIYDFGGTAGRIWRHRKHRRGFAGSKRRLLARRRHLRNRERLPQLYRLQAARRHNWRSRAASWICPTRSTKRRVRTILRSWSVPRPASSRRNIAAGDFRSTFGARWYTDRVWLGAYATGSDHRRDPLGLEPQPQRYDGAGRRDGARRGSGRERQRLHVPSRWRRRVADPSSAQRDYRCANPDLERSSGIAASTRPR